MNNTYAQICLKRRMPQNLQTLTYEIPDKLKESLKIGSYVNVPLRGKASEGIVLRKTEEIPKHNTKQISKLIYENPILQTWHINLAKWMSDYYMAPIQKTISLFLPPKFYKSDLLKDEKKVELFKKHKLTDSQQEALDKIINSDKKTTLIHGVTGSGKTEVYLHLVEKSMQKGKQSIIVVPEISLTPQTVQYFQRIFGDKVAILHSRLTEKQKSLEWLKIYIKKTPIVIGPRSALFAPVSNLDLIILDEEHEFSYKQEQSPRYHTRTVAEKITELTGCKLVLGSATPSISSYQKTVDGEYNLVELPQRIGNVPLPPVEIIDLREEFKKQNYSILSDRLQKELTNTLAQKKQAILFLNKRGSASAIVCRECGYSEKCEACDVPMTYHKTLPQQNSFRPSLICHHCGAIKNIPLECPNCKSHSIKYIGAGTQKVEEEVRMLFPEARVARVDRDTVAKRGSFDEIYNKLKNEELDILIGTQMIGKGLHFPKVNLVGVILADIGLHFPDFRSSERTFQLLTQVAGRAGRMGQTSNVIIQTYMPDNYAIMYAKSHDYKSLFKHEIDQRKTFNYPPFSKLLKLTFVDLSAKKALLSAQKVHEIIKEKNDGSNIINMYPAIIFKLHNKFRWHILIQGKNPKSLIEDIDLPENCRVDIDPISTG
ncbi:primosomal protein N' [bacterium]|nr:primosomal protein N' [bacterium]